VGVPAIVQILTVRGQARAKNGPHPEGAPHRERTREFRPHGGQHPDRQTIAGEFMPMLRRVMAQHRHSIYLKKEQAT
jgi:hypothetical protein